MVVPNVLVIGANIANDITFHDLHVINIIEQLETLRSNPLGEIHPPRGMVTLVVLMIDLTVEQLHADGHLMFFGQAHDLFQTYGTILQTCFIVQPLPVTREANDVGKPCLGHLRDHALKAFNQLGMMLDPVESLGDAARTIGHGTDQPMFLDHGILIGVEQFD